LNVEPAGTEATHDGEVFFALLQADNPLTR